MGTGELAFDPSGRVFPCERLVSSRPEEHAIGSVSGLVQIGPLREHLAPGPPINAECAGCGVRDYCVNWCGCSNYFMTGHYNRVGPFLCASERTLLAIAAQVFETLEAELGPTFTEHLGGKGVARSVLEAVRM
ncbi:MAG TPA: SPASM domain-containing protein [Anaeromyxobacteraceae bacterium]|nr:SPASM domain-containing protein [Anaeromyxobacteraceae bacterium]